MTDEKQIKVDLHRTLPNNKYFKLNGSGVSPTREGGREGKPEDYNQLCFQIPKLENILLAFSRHNRNVGYCQV